MRSWLTLSALRSTEFQPATGPMTRQLLVAVATSFPSSPAISALEKATRLPGLVTMPVARRMPVSLVTGLR